MNSNSIAIWLFIGALLALNIKLNIEFVQYQTKTNDAISVLVDYAMQQRKAQLNENY